MTSTKLYRDEDGTLPAFAWPGGYPMYYFLADGEVLCPDCANGKNDSDASETTEDALWKIVAGDVFWEGPSELCAHCHAEIESAYGNPDEDDGAGR